MSMTVTPSDVSDKKELYAYEKRSGDILDNVKSSKRKSVSVDVANKIDKVANETPKTTSPTSWKSIPDVKELEVNNEELKTRNEHLAAQIEELKKQTDVFQELNSKLNEELSAAKDKYTVLQGEFEDQLKVIEDYKTANSLSSSAILTTTVKNSASSLQDKLSTLNTDINTEIKNIDEILTKKFKDNSADFFAALKQKLAIFDTLRAQYETEYGHNDAHFKQVIDRGHATANHWNLDRILLRSSAQGYSYLKLLSDHYEILNDLNEDIKKLQFAYETLVKNEYRNELEFSTLTSSVNDKVTVAEDRINEAKAGYKKLPEIRKEELLNADFDRLFKDFQILKATLSEVDLVKQDAKQSEILSLLSTIDTEIKKPKDKLSDKALDGFEIYRQSVEDKLKANLLENAVNHNQRYTNLRMWASTTLNEIRNNMKKLETEIKLLGERTLVHKIQHSFAEINLIKGDTKSSPEDLATNTTIWNNAIPNHRAAHVLYHQLIDNYTEILATLSAKIADVKGENALKADLDDYAIDDFAKRENVIADLIKTLKEQQDMVTKQKKLIEEKWKALTDRIYATATDLHRVASGGWLTVGNLSPLATNTYMAIYTELNTRPAKPKQEAMTASQKT